MSQTENRGLEYRASGRLEEALGDFQRVVDFSEKNPEPARTYPEWHKLLQTSLEDGAELEKELAARDRSAHAEDRAEAHERAAGEFVAKLKALPN